MNEPLLNWWGFRLRLPAGYEPTPVTRLESAIVCLVVASVLQLFWLMRLVVIPVTPGKYSYLRDVLCVPLGVVLFLAGIFFILLPSAIRFLRLEFWLVLSRESGEMPRWDFYLAAAGAICALLSLFQLARQYWFALLMLSVQLAVLTILLKVGQQRVDFSKRTWEVNIPDWLKKSFDFDDSKKDQDEVVPPDANAIPLYTLEVNQESSYPVGIRIPDQLLNAIRKINADAGGYLYQTDPLAAVLCDRSPVENLGREELDRFCAQIFSIAKKHKLTHLQFANLVLNFVQRAISYEFDEDSTGSFPGGPYREYGRLAIESIHDSVGDCECTSIFCATLLAYLGFKCSLLHVTVTGNAHCAVGLDASELRLGDQELVLSLDYVTSKEVNGRKFLYGETAVDGGVLPFGVIPAEWKQDIAVDKIVPIPAPMPMLGN